MPTLCIVDTGLVRSSQYRNRPTFHQGDMLDISVALLAQFLSVRQGSISAIILFLSIQSISYSMIVHSHDKRTIFIHLFNNRGGSVFVATTPVIRATGLTHTQEHSRIAGRTFNIPLLKYVQRYCGKDLQYSSVNTQRDCGKGPSIFFSLRVVDGIRAFSNLYSSLYPRHSPKWPPLFRNLKYN